MLSIEELPMENENNDSSNGDVLFEQYIATKDIALRNQLIEKYLYIAEIAAKKFVGRGVEYEDLYQVASLALVKAIERFEPSRNIKFSSFATPSLIGEIKNYFRDFSRVMRLPRRDMEQMKKINLYIQEYMALKGVSPSPKEIAEHINVTVERIHEVMEMKQADNMISLDYTVAMGENCTLGKILGQEDVRFEYIENHDFFNFCMNLLSEMEREIIKQRYISGRTQRQVAQNLGVSQMQISRMERKILDKLAGAYRK